MEEGFTVPLAEIHKITLNVLLLFRTFSITLYLQDFITLYYIMSSQHLHNGLCKLLTVWYA